jgi:hypothetical protein
MKAVLLSLTIALAACSSTSKEVYTEKRVFTYPKGQAPHLKDMYVQPQAAPQPQIEHTYVGTNNPEPIDNYDSLFAPVPEPQDHWSNSDIPENSIQDLERENYYLSLMAKNRMLRGIQ